MTTQEKTTVAAPALAIIALALFAGGCTDESNQAACERAIRHTLSCASPTGDLPPEADLYVVLYCAAVPETSECDDWSAFADCMSAIDCDGFSTAGPEALESCGDISVGLSANGCFPTGFGV